MSLCKQCNNKYAFSLFNFVLYHWWESEFCSYECYMKYLHESVEMKTFHDIFNTMTKEQLIALRNMDSNMLSNLINIAIKEKENGNL